MSTVRLSTSRDREPVRMIVHSHSRDNTGPWSIELDGQRVDLEVGVQERGSGWFRRDGKTHLFHVRGNKETVRVWLDGKTYTLFRPAPSAQRASAGAHGPLHEDLKAPMPGTVLQIKVTEGETFEAKQALIILESMKMEMTLSIPHGGVVEKIYCKTGDLVEMGAVLATLTDDADE